MDSFNINISPETQEIVITQGEPINISINEDVVQINQTKEDYNLNFEGEVVKIDANYPQALEAARIATEKAEEATQIVEGFDEHAQEKITEYDSNASDKTAAYNLNATEKTNAFNSNATDKTYAFNLNTTSKTSDFNSNVSDKTTAFNSNATSKTGDFNDNATSKTTAFNENAISKTTAFNENASEKQALVDASAQASSQSAAEAKQWAIGDPSEPTGNSAKYWAEQAASELSGLTSRVSTIEGEIPSEASSSNQLADKSYVDTADNGLQTQIDAIVSSSDVFDIVGTYAELQAYDISTVPVNDIVKVLVDSTHNDAATYYRCVENSNVKSWSYIGSEGAYYTKGEANALLATKQDTLVSGTNIKTVNGSSVLGSGNLTTSAQWGGITGTLSDQTDLQTALNGKQDVATAVNYDNISNCITEIPQDIKLELNNGTLTLKAGSKVYVPNGSGVFDVVTIESDRSLSPTGLSRQDMFCFKPSGNMFNYNMPNKFYSGSVAPSGSQYMTWYDTANNLVKTTSDGGTTWTSGYSLPIGLFTSTSKIDTIDQVFNGFGYIGNTIFALPGVKGLIPNERNVDGTLKNTETASNGVLTYTNPDTATGNYYVQFRGDHISRANSNPSSWRYDEEKNIILYNNTSKQNVLFAGNLVLSSGRVESLTPKTAFHALDYNDFNNLTINVLKTVYPVGAVYIGTTSTCPLAALFGTWTLKSSGRVLQGADSSHSAGTTIEAGLPNITGGFTASTYQKSSSHPTLIYGSFATTDSTIDCPNGDNNGGRQFTFDASRSSSIYGNSSTVQPPAYVVNIWERTA